MNYKLYVFIIFILSNSASWARQQTLDSIALAKIGSQLVNKEIETREGISKPGDNCVRDKDGHFLSCLSAESSVNWITDFNKAGWPDAVFLFREEGLGGGGNAYGFDYRVVLLNKSHQILNQFTLFGGG